MAGALKVLNRKLLDDPDFLLRFQNEAASTGRIHHPNVVTIHESGQADDGTTFIAMELLEGESLRQSLTRRGALPVAKSRGVSENRNSALPAPLPRCYTGEVAANLRVLLEHGSQMRARREATERCPSG
ncbi:MAG: hypothetical protein ABSA59_19770 [Terriglobia bacterium]